MRRTLLALNVLALLALAAASPLGTGMAVVYTDVANVFTANQRINAGFSVNVAPGATGTVSSSGAHFERSRSTAMGEWLSPGFSAGNYTANGSMTWTVDPGDFGFYSYTLVGKTMFIKFAVDTTSVGGTPSTDLLVAIPGGFTSASTAFGHLFYSNNGSYGIGLIQVNPSSTNMRCLLPTLGNWSASTNNTAAYGFVFIEVP